MALEMVVCDDRLAKPTVVEWWAIDGRRVGRRRRVVRRIMTTGHVSSGSGRGRVNRRDGRRRRMVADPRASQSAFQKMAETSHVDRAGLGRSSVMMLMMNAVHQTGLDLARVRLPLTVERLLPAAYSDTERCGWFINKTNGRRWCAVIVLVLGVGARANYIGIRQCGCGGGSDRVSRIKC